MSDRRVLLGNRIGLAWVAAEIACAVWLYRLGHPIDGIARILGRTPKQTEKRLEEEHAKRGRMRRCLCCGKPFLSAGAHNFVCEVCRDDEGTGLHGVGAAESNGAGAPNGFPPTPPYK